MKLVEKNVKVNKKKSQVSAVETQLAKDDIFLACAVLGFFPKPEKISSTKTNENKLRP